MVVVIKSTLDKNSKQSLLVVIVLLRYLSRTHAVTLSVLFLFPVCFYHICVGHSEPQHVDTCPPLQQQLQLSSVLSSVHQQNLSLLPADALFYLHAGILFLFTAIWLQNALQHDTTTNNLLGIIGETQLHRSDKNLVVVLDP